MSDETKPAPRIIEAVLYRGSNSLGPIDLVGSTKHGDTTLLAVEEDDVLREGDALKTKVYVLNSRDFVVVRKHDKPMKLAGFWYEVRAQAPASRPARR